MSFLKSACITAGAPMLVVMAYALDAWLRSDAVRLPIELQQIRFASVVGSLFPKIIFMAATLVVGWILLIRNKPSLCISLVYMAAGTYLLLYLPLIRLAFSVRETVGRLIYLLYYPLGGFPHVGLSMHSMMHLSFAALLVLGAAGLLRWGFFQTQLNGKN